MKRTLLNASAVLAFVLLIGAAMGWRVHVRADGLSGFSLIIQNAGSPIGGAVTLNCSTGTSCSISGGVVTLTASGSGGGITQLTGDGTAGPGSGSQALTLATVLTATPGSCGDTTHSCSITANGKGLITALSNNSISGGGGGSSISFGATASLPGTATAGNMYVATDSPLTFIGNATPAWVPFLPGVSGQTYLPQATGWSFTNQGTASVDTTRGGINLVCPATSANSYKAYMRTAISPPWTVDTGAFLSQVNEDNYSENGIIMYESGTGKFVAMTIQSNTPNQLLVIVGTALSSGGATARLQQPIYLSGWQWFQMSYDSVGAKVDFRVSADGRNWITVVSESVTADFTTAPDTYGIVTNPRNANYNTGNWLLYWNERASAS